MFINNLKTELLINIKLTIIFKIRINQKPNRKPTPSRKQQRNYTGGVRSRKQGDHFSYCRRLALMAWWYLSCQIVPRDYKKRVYDDGTDFDADISDEQHGIDVPVVANGEHPDLYSLFLLFLLLEKLPFFITFLSLFSMLPFCCSVFWDMKTRKTRAQ